MNPGFWAERWREGRIGFHEGRPNTFLERHAAQLGRDRTVLVPLCGKAEDLAYLASLGHRVIGVELVRDAVEAFFAEHRLKPAIEKRGAFERFSVNDITLLVGDFFALQADDVGDVSALYDRAAIIALPPELRGRYVKKLRELLPSSAPGLIVTLDYPQHAQPGPPFSVPDAELRAHYQGCDVQLLEEQRWTSRGDEKVQGSERCYAVKLATGG